MPTALQDIAKIQDAVRNPGKYNANRNRAWVDLPVVTMLLTGCYDDNKTPWLDLTDKLESPGSIVIAFTNGDELELTTEDIRTWEALAAKIFPSRATVQDAEQKLIDVAAEEERLTQELHQARENRTAAMVAAESLGISRYRISQLTGKSQAGVKKILDAANPR